MTAILPDPIRWGQGGLAFELSVSDPQDADAARAVFRPWPPARDAAIATSFALERRTAQDTRHGSWRVTSSSSLEVVDHPTLGAALRAVELRAVECFVPLVDGPLAVHGALLDVDGRGVLLVGPSTAGKSSLACALWREGHRLLGDDVALVDLATAHARPGPRRVALRLSSRSLVDDDLWARIVAAPSAAPTDDGYAFHPGDLDPRPSLASTELALVVFLARRDHPPGEPASLTPLEPAHAVLAWLPYLVVGGRLDTGSAIRRAAALAERVPACDLQRGPLDAMTRHVMARLNRDG